MDESTRDIIDSAICVGRVLVMVSAVLLSWRSWVMIAVWDSSADCRVLICWDSCSIACGIWRMSVSSVLGFVVGCVCCKWLFGGLCTDISGGFMGRSTP